MVSLGNYVQVADFACKCYINVLEVKMPSKCLKIGYLLPICGTSGENDHHQMLEKFREYPFLKLQMEVPSGKLT